MAVDIRKDVFTNLDPRQQDVKVPIKVSCGLCSLLSKADAAGRAM